MLSAYFWIPSNGTINENLRSKCFLSAISGIFTELSTEQFQHNAKFRP